MSTNTHVRMLTSRDLLFYKDAIKGEITYEIDSNSYYIYNDSGWEKLSLKSDKQEKQRKHSTICPRCGAPMRGVTAGWICTNSNCGCKRDIYGNQYTDTTYNIDYIDYWYEVDENPKEARQWM